MSNGSGFSSDFLSSLLSTALSVIAEVVLSASKDCSSTVFCADSLASSNVVAAEPNIPGIGFTGLAGADCSVVVLCTSTGLELLALSSSSLL